MAGLRVGGEKRRLCPIPPRWDEDSDEQLWGHCILAEPVRRRPAEAAPPELEAPL